MTQQGVIFVGGKGEQLTLPNPHFSRLRFSREATLSVKGEIMLRHCSSALAITFLSLTTVVAQPAATPDAKYKAAAIEEKFDSPRLAALAKEIKAGNRAALEAFW